MVREELAVSAAPARLVGMADGDGETRMGRRHCTTHLLDHVVQRRLDLAQVHIVHPDRGQRVRRERAGLWRGGRLSSVHSQWGVHPRCVLSRGHGLLHDEPRLARCLLLMLGRCMMHGSPHCDRVRERAPWTVPRACLAWRPASVVQIVTLRRSSSSLTVVYLGPRTRRTRREQHELARLPPSALGPYPGQGGSPAPLAAPISIPCRTADRRLTATAPHGQGSRGEPLL